MTMTPIPCISTSLDVLQLRDMRTRVESILTRLEDPSAKVGKGALNNGFEVRDAHGVIKIYEIRSDLAVNAGSCGELGPCTLEMPLPAWMKRTSPVSSEMTDAGFDAMLAHLQHWRTTSRTEQASTVEGLRIGNSGFARLLRMVSALIRSENPELGPRARISFRCPSLYDTAPNMFGEAPKPGLGVKQGNTIKPVLNAALTERILELHPGMTVESNGGRDYRMRRLEEMRAMLPPVPAIEALRYAGDLGIDPTKRIVLKTGMDLR